MGLKHGSSSGVDMRELIGIVEAFEKQNRVTIRLRAELTTTKAGRDMRWTAEAFAAGHILPGQLPLASANALCSEKRLGTMEAVVLRLLYALDFDIAEKEWNSEGLIS